MGFVIGIFFALISGTLLVIGSHNTGVDSPKGLWDEMVKVLSGQGLDTGGSQGNEDGDQTQDGSGGDDINPANPLDPVKNAISDLL